MFLSKPYHDIDQLTLIKLGQEMYIKKWKISSYVEGFKNAGLYLDTSVEDVDQSILKGKHDDLHK